MGKLEGKVAVITGASSGLALATAKRFVKEGAYVFITGLSTAASRPSEITPDRGLARRYRLKHRHHVLTGRQVHNVSD